MQSIRPIPEEQAAYERTVIFDMISTLEQVKEQGYSDWQTLTSFLANLLLDQVNPRKLLKQLTDDVKLKVDLMRDTRRKENTDSAPWHRATPAPERALPDQTVVRCSSSHELELAVAAAVAVIAGCAQLSLPTPAQRSDGRASALRVHAASAGWRHLRRGPATAARPGVVVVRRSRSRQRRVGDARFGRFARRFLSGQPTMTVSTDHGRLA